jgi:cell division septation protein DedD
MRNLFFGLVLANLAFAAWHSWYSPSRVPHPVDSDLPKLTLVSEVPPEIADRRRANAAAPDVRLPEEPPTASTPSSPDAKGSTPPSALANNGPPPSGAPGGSVVRGTSTALPAAAGNSSSPPVASSAASAQKTGAPASTPETAGATHCTSVGPFRELAQAATAAATMRAAGYQPTQRVADGEIWIGYWIYIDAIPTEAEANAILAKVRGQGITESYVIPNSDSGNLVSLGVFGEIGNVTRRREQVRALGYDPKVVDRTRRATVYWVDVVLAGDQTVDLDKLQTPGKIQRLEQRACEVSAR